ncbi:hypothetical protein [Desulfosarcina ovata]|uniref:Uncharacterized protein n=1 Tax=Desulfosarcina ovata subsp. ovata TaxID=2752305 RepID=A0A5K8A664_9BACT|nr:hypothetical protein [Desulfosarcina ovata]BBO87951.1 hypothetical protein DSCOOX_11310 [Desulfosarcina ovata subsp. ovata]
MIQIEIGIAIEIEKEMGRRHADWVSIDMGNWKTGNRLLPFCQPVIPIYIVDSDFDPDFDKPELHAVTPARAGCIVDMGPVFGYRESSSSRQ